MLSLRARLGIALDLFHRYCARRGLAHPEIDRYLDYLWEFIGFYGDPEPFRHWLDREPALVQAGLQDVLPPGVIAVSEAAGVPEAEFRQALESCTEVLYTSLFAAANEALSRSFLLKLAHAVNPHGIWLPDLRRFAGSRWADDSGWGHRPTPEELARWRCPP
jgi:hypothetical protein